MKDGKRRSRTGVRVGFVGAGGIAENHLKRLREIPLAEVAAVCDTFRPAAEKVAPPGAEVFEDYRRMLDAVRLDAVYVCVPPDAHGDIEVEAAARGIHLFVEKPVNRTMEEARRVEKAVLSAGVISAAGYGLRYLPFMEQLRRVLAEHPAYQAVVVRWGGLPSKEWWRRMASSGGQLVEMVTHQVDMLRSLWGEPEWVCASFGWGMHVEDGVDVPSNHSVVMDFGGGRSAVISAACGTKAGRNDALFLTREAVVEVNYSRGIAVRPEGAFEAPDALACPDIDESFIRAVATGDRSFVKSDYSDAVLSLAATLACNISAEEGRVVEFREVAG